MSGVSVRKAPSNGPYLYHSSKPEKTDEGSVKLQKRFKKLFERSDKKKMRSHNPHKTSIFTSTKRTPSSTAVATSYSATNPGFNFGNLTTLLIRSFSLNHLLRSKPMSHRRSDELGAPDGAYAGELAHIENEKETSCLEATDQETVSATAGQVNHLDTPQEVGLSPSQEPIVLSCTERFSTIVAGSRTSPSKIAYFQGLHKLKNCEHRRLREILLIHQTITKAHHIMITEGLHPESIQERRNYRFTRTSSPALTSNSPNLPLLTAGASYGVKHFIPSPSPSLSPSPYAPPPYRPCDEDDVPLGVLQLGYKRII